MKKTTWWIIAILVILTFGALYLPEETLTVDTTNRVKINKAVQNAANNVGELAEEGEDAVEDVLEDIVEDVLGDDDEDADDENDDDADGSDGDDDDDADDAEEVAAEEGNTEVILENAGYIEYDEVSVSEALDAGKDVALFFHAPWCGTCSALNSDIEANAANIDDNTMIFKVDYDSSTELKEEYTVTKQHTVVILNGEGELVNSFQGTATLDGVISDIASTKS